MNDNEYYVESPYKTYESSEKTYWKEFELAHVKMINNIVKRAKKQPFKEMVSTEIQYAVDKKEPIGLYSFEWKFVVDVLTEKLQTKGTRNKEEIEYLIQDITKFIKKEIN